MPNGKRGLLLTDCAHSGNPFWPTPQKENFRSRGGKRINEMGLDRAVKAYPTPRSRLTGNVCPSRCADKFNNLESVLSRMLWPTPKGSPSGPDYARAGRDQSGGDDLVTAIARMTFPTPTSSMMTEADLIQAKFHSSKRPTYQEAKNRFPTPTAQDAKQVDPPCHRDGKRRTPCLGSHVNKQAETAGGQLNPDWVEWLMGWPIGWTALDSANRAVSTVSSSKGSLNKILETGFYMITLSPKKGSWSSRLSSAPNAPPNLSHCCGTAVITIAPDLNTVTDAFQKMKDAVKKPMADASNIVNPFDFSDFEPEDEPEDLEDLDEEEMAAQDWSDLFTTDEWSSAALKDVFGGYAEGITKATNKLSKATRSVMASVNQASRAASAINKGLSATKNIMAQMQGTGVYRVVLAPGQGNYLQRLRSESGAPPSSGQLFSSGYVCITVAESLSALESKYDTLSKIVSG